MSKKITADAKKKAARRKQRAAEYLARFITTLACLLAAAYVIIRVINWIRFI